MPTITYKIKYKKNTGKIFSAGELLALYFYGISIQVRDGSEFDKTVVDHYIESAQKLFEDYFQIKLFPCLISEKVGYYRSDYYGKYPIFQTKYPVKEAHTIIGLLNTTNQIVYPKAWINTHTDNPDGDYPKFVCLIPTGTSTVTGSMDVILTGIMTNIGLQRWNHIPNYWFLQYVTGYDYDNIPMDIVNIIGMAASIGVFNVAGDIALGQAALASYSLSIDGLSQSISTTNSATSAAFNARILSYNKEIKDSYETSQRISDRISAKVGANHETGKKLVEMLEYNGFKVDLIKPLPKRWKGVGGKITHEELNEILKRNKFDELKRSNQDVRDSTLIALAAYGKM